MSGIQPTRGKAVAVVAAALCTVVSLFTNITTAAAVTPESSTASSGLAGRPLRITLGNVGLPTGVAVANLPRGASGPVSMTIGLCNPGLGMTCSSALSEFSLAGNFKDAAGRPLYSNSAPASVSWTCNPAVCPTPRSFVPGRSTVTQLQVEEFRSHAIYVAPVNSTGQYQQFASAPACNGVSGARLPTGSINPQATGGQQFCIDVGAISRGSQRCQTACSAWSGALTLPVLFVEDPKFMGT
jgi:hypothetical protein